MLLIARFNQPAVEGATVPVPNIIDRTVAELKRLLAPARRSQPLPRTKVMHNAQTR